MFKQFFKSFFPLLVILSLFISTQAQAICSSIGLLWSWSSIWTGCLSSPPATNDSVNIQNTVNLDQNATVDSVTITGGSSLNANSFTLTLTATTPLTVNGSFNAGTSTVKLSDAAHTFDSNMTLYNLQWATPITAPRTISILNSTITIATGGAFSLDGSSSTNKVTFTGNGSVIPTVTLTNCTSNVTGINCLAGGSGAVSAPIFSLKDKPVMFSEELKE